MIEIDFGEHTNFDWSHENFDKGVLAGRAAAKEAWRKHEQGYFKDKAKEARDRWRRALEKIDDEKKPPERPLPLEAAAE